MSLQERAIAYLKDELSESEKAEFENELLRSEALREELLRSREMLEVLEAASDAAISRLANAIVQQALQEKASDIHIVPESRSVAVKYRIDGALREAMRLPVHFHHPLIDRFKVMVEADVNERRLPQDGRASVDHEGKSLDFRVTFLPTVCGERMTGRFIDLGHLQVGLELCGLSQEQNEAIQRILASPSGLIFVTGSFVSGKMTMLYSLLKALQERSEGTANIMTIEDPVALVVNGWSQTMVMRGSGLTFPVLQRVALRNDPDIIMVSELRDGESAKLAVETAITGHLVLSQLQVPRSVDVMEHLHQMGIDRFQIAQKLVGVIAMRLVPRICTDCVEEYMPNPRVLQHAGFSLDDGPFRRGKGCPQCLNRGWRGRVPLYEIWEVDADLRDAIAANPAPDALWQQTFGARGGSLWDDARAKIRRGEITVEHAIEALFDYPLPASPIVPTDNT